MKERKVELLAPAGNIESFYGAIGAGADAVYLGGDRFGARAYADNFTIEELQSCIRYAHVHGKKIYLTVNTLLKERELQELCDYLSPIYEAGLDGVIVQDVGVLSLIRQNFPELELHASTQMTITASYGAELLKQMGVCRVVPARELSLEELFKLKQDTGLELETFIHGAMCYSYSGQCLFSSVLGGRSGNRGRCAQPCRLPYRVSCKGRSTEECYPLSLKDMCTIEYLPELIDAGIDSFKIEGRMKKPEYTAGVTAIYRKYIDICQAEGFHRDSFHIEKKDLEALSKLYIRSEMQAGYYFKQNGSDMVTLKNPSYNGSDDELLQTIRSRYLSGKKKLPVTVKALFRIGEPAKVAIVQGTTKVTVTGTEVTEAIKQPVTGENIKKQLGKLGETSFYAKKIEIESDDNAFYSLKAINELRRTAIDALEDALIFENHLPVRRDRKEVTNINSGKMYLKNPKAEKISVSVMTLEQLRALVDSDARCNILFSNASLVMEDKETCLTLFRNLLSRGMCEEVFLTFPYILRSKDYEELDQMLSFAEENADIVKGIQIRSLEGLGYLLKKQYKGNVYTDAGFYMWNKKTVEEWKSYLTGFCLPYELNGSEQKELLKDGLAIRPLKIIYGRIPMMISANCVAKTTVGCQKERSDGAMKRATLTDRYHKQFPVQLDCRHCYNIIYNSVPLSLHRDLSKWKESAEPLVCFTVEKAGEVAAVLNYFSNRMESRECVLPYDDYTTGHDKRGVE